MSFILHGISLHKENVLFAKGTSEHCHIQPLTLSSRPRAWRTRPANHRWYSWSGGFVTQQHPQAAQHDSGHTHGDDQEHGGAQRAAAVHGHPSADSRHILLTIWILGNVETPSFLLLKSVPQAGKNNRA